MNNIQGQMNTCLHTIRTSGIQKQWFYQNSSTSWLYYRTKCAKKSAVNNKITHLLLLLLYFSGDFFLTNCFFLILHVCSLRLCQVPNWNNVLWSSFEPIITHYPNLKWWKCITIIFGPNIWILLRFQHKTQQ